MKKYIGKIIIWQAISIIGLNIAYVFVISHKFSYMGFTLDFNIVKLILGTIILLLTLLLNFLLVDKFIFAVWNIIYIYLLAGEVIYFQYTKDASLIQILSVMLTLIILVGVSRTKKVFGENRILKNADQILTPLSFILFIPFVVLYYRYIDIKNLFFIDVYKTRQIFRSVSTPLTGYIQAPLVRIILPFLIVQNIEKKNWWKVLIFSLMIIYIYLCGALKSVFFGLLALLLFYKGDYYTKILRFLKAVSFFSFFGIIFEKITGSVFFLDSFIRRVFFVPPYLNQIYIKHFTDNHTYLSHSPFGFIESEIQGSLSLYVGEVIMGIEGLNANVGVFTEGYISFGILGTLVFSFLICAIFLFLKMIRISPKYFGVVFVYIYYLNTAFFSTLLLTHGLFFFLIFSYLFLREKKTSSPLLKSDMKRI